MENLTKVCCLPLLAETNQFGVSKRIRDAAANLIIVRVEKCSKSAVSLRRVYWYE